MFNCLTNFHQKQFGQMFVSKKLHQNMLIYFLELKETKLRNLTEKHKKNQQKDWFKLDMIM